MRVTDRHTKRWAATIARRVLAALALCAVATPGMAAELVQSLPNLWVSATALSLSLATAASKPKN